MALNFNKYAAKGNEFMKELAKELGYPEDLDKAGRVLEAVLQAVRNRLPIGESLQLLSQLPMFLKAAYVENWSIKGKQKRIHHLKDFYQEVRDLDGFAAHSDFKRDEDIDDAVSVVFMILRNYVSFGEIEDIRATLPKEIKSIVGYIDVK